MSDEVKEVRREVRAVREVLDRVGEVLDANTQTFASALSMVDMHIHILQRVTNDLVTDKAYRLENDGVDFSRYMAEYLATTGFVSFIAALKKQEVVRGEQTPPPDDVVVFGG